MLKQTQCVGFSVFDPCLSKIATYDCSDVENTELSKKRNSFVREDAKSGEFPHIAGIILCIDQSRTFKFVVFEQQLAGILLIEVLHFVAKDR